MNKNRILLYFISVYCIGLYFGSISIVKIEIVLYLFIIECIVSIILYIKGRKVSCLIYLCTFFIGVYSSCSYIQEYNRQIKSFEGKTVAVSGQISGDIYINGSTTRYIFYADTINTEDRSYNVHTKLNVIDFKNNNSYIKPYNTLTISGEFQQNSGYKNTGMLSYDEYLMIKGVWGTVVAGYSPTIKSNVSNKRPIARFVYNIKYRAENILSQYLEGPTCALMKGILFGDTEGIDEDQYESFKKSGVIHIFAVSGYNIWLLYYILSNALFFLKHRLKLKNYILIFLLFLYSLLSGWTPSVARAFIMAAVLLYGKTIGREADPLTSLSVSALVILVPKPLYILEPGFQLSFLCVLSIILLLPRLKRIRIPVSGKLNDIILGSIAIQLGILPVIAYHFNSLPVLSLVSNIVILPFVSVLTICGMLLIVLGAIFPAAAMLLGIIVNILSRIIIRAVEYIGLLSFASLTVVSPSTVEIAAYYITLVLLSGVITVSIKYKRLVLGLAAVLIFTESILALFPGKLKLSFIDVGQGDCILFITPDKKAVMIDGGGKPKTSYSNFDVGERVVKPYLLKHGIKKLDMVVSTHGHDDHLLGLIPVFQSFDVGTFINGVTSNIHYDSIFGSSATQKTKIISVSRGDLVDAGKYVKLYILNPDGDEKDENDSSIVIKLEYKNFTALLTGDISKNVENDIRSFPLKSNIMKIPHHGSDVSLKQEFIDAVEPDEAVICVGRNSFGHPGRKVLDMLKDEEIKVYRTDKDGEVIVTTDGLKYSIKTANSH